MLDPVVPCNFNYWTDDYASFFIFKKTSFMQAHIIDESSEVLVALRTLAEMPQLATYTRRRTFRTCIT